MNIFQAVSTCLSKFATFSGRASRSEFWWFFLAHNIFSYLLEIAVDITILNNAQESTAVLIGIVIILIILWIPVFAAASRRLHDTGWSGWWQLLVFTLIGWVPLLIWLIRKGSKEPNKYGDPTDPIAAELQE